MSTCYIILTVIGILLSNEWSRSMGSRFWSFLEKLYILANHFFYDTAACWTPSQQHFPAEDQLASTHNWYHQVIVLCLYTSVFPFVMFSAIICCLFFWSVCSNSSADSVIRSRAALISGRLLSSADAFTAIDKSCKHQCTISVIKLPVTDCITTLSIEDFLL